jgi:hypothetical protein
MRLPWALDVQGLTFPFPCHRNWTWNLEGIRECRRDCNHYWLLEILINVIKLKYSEQGMSKRLLA